MILYRQQRTPTPTPDAARIAARKDRKMNSVYVGKRIGPSSFEMCLVIDSRISDAAALVYNIAHNTIEILPLGSWYRQERVFQEIAEENRHTWQAKMEKQIRKNQFFVDAFSD